MSRRDAIVGAVVASVVLMGGAVPCGAASADAAREEAKAATSYVLLAETISRVSLQVGGMLDRHPFDRALAYYARGLGRLHVRMYEKLTPPEPARILHRRFKEAVAEFAQMAEAHYKADYKTSRKHRERCVKDFLQALGELNRMKKRGLVPSISHGGGDAR
jgi:hypothetical protein